MLGTTNTQRGADGTTGAVVTAATAGCEPRWAPDAMPAHLPGLDAGRGGAAVVAVGITESFRLCWLLWAWRTQTATEVGTGSARDRLSKPQRRSSRDRGVPRQRPGGSSAIAGLRRGPAHRKQQPVPGHGAFQAERTFRHVHRTAAPCT